MRSRKDFIDRLRKDEKFTSALARARTPEERTKVQTIVEEFVGSFADVLAPLIEQSMKDPEFAAQLGRALNEKQNVLSHEEPATSGSIG